MTDFQIVYFKFNSESLILILLTSCKTGRNIDSFVLNYIDDSLRVSKKVTKIFFIPCIIGNEDLFPQLLSLLFLLFISFTLSLLLFYLPLFL